MVSLLSMPVSYYVKPFFKDPKGALSFFLRVEVPHELERLSLNVGLWLGRRMPKRLRYYATLTAISHATTGEFGNTVPSELDVMTLLQRCDAQTKRPPRKLMINGVTD